MKIAISIPDPLFASADALARRLKVSRSRLYAAAIAEYLERQRSDRVTERLDQVYGTGEHALPKALRRAARKTAERNEW